MKNKRHIQYRVKQREEYNIQNHQQQSSMSTLIYNDNHSNESISSSKRRAYQILKSPSKGIQVFRESYDNMLTSLLENEMWFEAYMRCISHPFECLPVALKTKRHVIYSHTPLGIACRKFTNKLVLIPSEPTSVMASGLKKQSLISQLTIIKALYYACPCQLRCNQMKVGLTPLLDIICNPYATTEVTKFLIDADRSQERDMMSKEAKSMMNMEKMNDMAIGRLDSNKLLPFHHLICQVHRNSTILPEDSKTNDLIDYLVNMYPNLTCTRCESQMNSNNASPLIHLFSQKVGFQKEDEELMPRIAKCAKILLASNPDLIKTKSVMTDCTPLHMALRNGYGDNIELITLLLKYDPTGYQVTQRNKFGDLPIHIIATMGACKQTWKLMLDHISDIHQNGADSDPIDGPSPFIWAINKSGCTPLHLCWMRQKSGKVSYPMSDCSNARVSQRQRVYIDSMQAAVEKVIASSEEDPKDLVDVNEMVRESIGQFWDILKLILRSVYFGEVSTKCNKADEFQNILHAVCLLVGPLLPRPIFNLIFALFKYQANKKDSFSRVPLHYACASVSFPLQQLSNIPSISKGWHEVDIPSEAITNKEYDCIIEQLLSTENTANLPDVHGFFPLHYIIKESPCSRIDELKRNLKIWSQRREMGHCVLGWTVVVKKVANACPDVLGLPTPNLSLYPFMVAASNQMDSSIDIIYYLMKMFPTNNFFHHASI